MVVLLDGSFPAPAPPAGSFDAEAADRGEVVFNGDGDCARCHAPPTFTDAGDRVHAPSETGMDTVLAGRGTTDGYRTTPLGGLFTRMKGGFFHDGRFATLLDVVNHYDQHFGLGLTPSEKSDLVEYLKSI